MRLAAASLVLALGLLATCRLAPACAQAVAHAVEPSSVAQAVQLGPEPQPALELRYDHPFLSDTAAGKWRAVGLGTLGVVSAFVAHELGHVLVNLAYGNVPSFAGLRYGGFLPFFRISHDLTCEGTRCVDRRGESFQAGTSGVYMITAAGFNVQHVVSEFILSFDPELRYHRSPFQKGMLLFNLGLSAAYVLTTWAQVKPPMGDIFGMSTVSRLDPNLIALFVAVPLGLDLFRFFVPSARWAPMVGRMAKLWFLSLGFAF